MRTTEYEAKKEQAVKLSVLWLRQDFVNYP